MEAGRREKGCRVVLGGSFPASAMMMFLLLFVAVIFDTASCMLFQSRRVEESCLPGITGHQLRELSRGMGNSSYLYGHLLRHIMVPRVSGTESNRVVGQFIKQEMESLGWAVAEDSFEATTPLGVLPFVNIIATQNPLARRRIVLACHYDSKYMPRYRTPFIGAIDSAVPCSVMIDTARKLREITSDAQGLGLNEYTLQYIFFDGEEAFQTWTATDSLYGSRHLAQLWENSPDPRDSSASNNLQNIDIFVLMDLIGNYRTRFVDYYRNTSNLFTNMYNIEQCLRNSRLLTSHTNRPLIFDPRGQAMLVEDDHTPFIQRGVRCLHLISTPFPNVWHTPYDTGRYLDVALIEDFSRILRVFLTSLLLGL
ncbi:glutaminyl-peptide cyclotransferase-like protein [Aplysia californica]|uniref:glutaminyl-peptide cyclotransferase n=1 Tax=Aplysia californica TaxID=6500 RepID=A0ABM1ADF9_APLCA|nr:glutaminyl-peptide cyclotransferase-like protein [Aplysia californica]